MPARVTKKPIRITLEKERKTNLDGLVDHWSIEQKQFILQALREYYPSVITPTKTTIDLFKEFFFGKEEREEEEKEQKICHLANEDIFKNPAERYRITGEQRPLQALHKIFDMEITTDDKEYLIYVLKQKTDDVYVPPELIQEFARGHRRHHKKLLIEEGNVPKAPFYLVIGPTGSGKTKTINTAIERAIFYQELEITQKKDEDLEAIVKEHPILARLDLEAVAPETAGRLEKERQKRKIKLLSQLPIVRRWYKEEVAELLEQEEEEDFGMEIDVDQIHPNNVQTMWYGETGNKMMQSFGPKSHTSIRVLEEAHALLRVHQSHSAQVQEDTLVSTFNIILDQIEKGERNCMVVALTRKGEEFHQDVYRRFQEKGKIIDMNVYWRDPKTIDELIKIEMKEQGIAMLADAEREAIPQHVLNIFDYRGLDVTPAYVRKLIASIAEMKGEIKSEYFEDGILVRRAFVNVARNLYPEMFRKTYNKLQRNVPWNEYVGDIKEEFQRIVNQCLVYNMAADKGVVLAGPPGSGKTYLVRTYLSRHKNISDVTLKMEDLQDERDPIDGPVRKLAEAFDIAKMCAPTVLFVDEGEAVAMERQGNIADRITNKLLNAVDGETELKGVFVALTTNKPEHLAEAATRSGRLKVMVVTGKLTEQDIYNLLQNNLKDEPLAPEVTNQHIYAIARQFCATPADYSKFFETIVNFKNEEVKVMRKATQVTDEQDLEQVITTNYKVMVHLLESLNFSKEIVKGTKQNIAYLLERKEEVITRIREAIQNEQYPITLTHIERAREDRVQTPRIRGKISIDDYLKSQLPSEPQIGFVMGAGASETTGTLVPIATSLVYGKEGTGEKISITGAVSIDAPAAAEFNAAVEMMRQSAKEALTLVLNYLETLLPEKAVKRIMGKYIEDLSFHHQFLTATYHSGGPSAGMALAVNTLSVLLDIPVRHDFGITGATWSRGKTKDDVGSAVIIGGTHNKTQIVLSYLNRMYVPIQNLKDVDFLTLERYWQEGKDVIGYENFPGIVGEVFYWGKEREQEIETFFKKRIEAKQQELVAPEEAKALYAQVQQLHKTSRTIAEEDFRKRILCIEAYIKQGEEALFLSPRSIFKKYANKQEQKL